MKLISFQDILKTKKYASTLRKQHPLLSRGELLSRAAIDLFCVRNFHELTALRKKTVEKYLVGDENLATCSYCGLQFCLNVKDDVKEHSRRHDAFEEASHVLRYTPQLYAEREASKQEGYQLLGNAEPQKRYEGAQLILRAWFDRSLVSAIDGKYWKKHPSFEKYVSYVSGDINMFPSDVAQRIVATYGTQEGVIPVGQTYWHPPRN